MKRKQKINICCWTIIIIAIAAAVFPYLTHLNRSLPDSADVFYDQVGTKWKSDTPEIEVMIDENNRAFGTILIEGKLVNIELFHSELDVVMFEDADRRTAENRITSDMDIIIGDCKFYKSKLVIQVTKSEVDETDIGDEIILYRIDE